MRPLLTLLIFSVFALTYTPRAHSDWDYSQHSIDTSEIQSGGPPRDGIPALFEPKTLPAQ